jgi:CubicO group peptidase (beta-lactamase class C family)
MVKKDPMAGYGRFVKTRMKEWNVPGVAIIIVKDGQTVLSEGFGLRNVSKGTPVTTQTLFPIGSCTKAFTTMLMAMLQDNGLFEWDKPVRDYLPGFKMYDPFATERLTPRDLVTHRSGLPRHDFVWLGSRLSRKDLFDRLRYLEPSKDLRTTFQYSNLMYAAAGHLIGELTDSSWEEQIHERIFGPLGMTVSNCSVTISEKEEGVALGYAERGKGLKRLPFCNMDNIGSAGAINSSIHDMEHWLKFLISGGRLGRKRLVSKQNVREICTPQTLTGGRSKESRSLGYSLGWGISLYRNHEMVIHDGGIDGFASITSLLPESKVGMVVLTNRFSRLPSLLAFNAQDRLLGLKPFPWNRRYRKEAANETKWAADAKRESNAARVKGTRTSHPLRDYVGDYSHPAYGTATVGRDRRGLALTFNGERNRLTHYHYDVFETTVAWLEGLKVTFAVDAGGSLRSFSAPLQDGVKDIVFERVLETRAGRVL